MKPIQTAEEFIHPDDFFNHEEYRERAIEYAKSFAKLHVKAALDAVVENARVLTGGPNPEKVTTIKVKTILNSYPETNIK